MCISSSSAARAAEGVCALSSCAIPSRRAERISVTASPWTELKGELRFVIRDSEEIDITRSSICSAALQADIVSPAHALLKTVLYQKSKTLLDLNQFLLQAF